MAKKENLKPFSRENQPKNRGSRKGTPNRATVLKKWLGATVTLWNPVTGKNEKVTVEDELMLALITRGRQGDVPAIREVLDSVYGKALAKHELSGEGGGAIPITIIEPVKPNA